LKSKTTEELVHIVDENTRRHEYENGEYDHRSQIDKAQLNNIENAAYFTISHLFALEARVCTTLPEDYKEFLLITDGMNSVWNGAYKESFVASISKARNAPDFMEGSSLEDRFPCGLLRWMNYREIQT